MKSFIRLALTMLGVTLCSTPMSSLAVAQSGTRGTLQRPRTQGSSTRGRIPARSPKMRSPKVAFNGYCTVCIRDMKKWVKGDPAFSVDYDGQTYLFPGPDQMEMFRKDPTKYVAVLGGDCVVCKVAMGDRVPGNIKYGLDYRGRYYFFPSSKQREEFKANPAAYRDADLAFGGSCSVCKVEMNEAVPGRPEFTTIYNGMRYQFPGPDQQKMFEANPAKYAVK